MMSKRVMRSFTLCMAAIMTFLCAAMLTKTDDVYAAGWSYTANGSGVKITKYTGSGSSVTVPSKLDGKEVNAIGDRVFANNEEIELVTLPAQNIVLGKGVFNGCSNLTTVNNSQYVTEIGTGCFAACSKLSSFTFSNSVQVLGDSTFQGTALTEVFLPSSVRSLQMKVFYNCTSLKKVTISNPDCNFNLATDTFTGTSGLTVYAPEGSTAKEYAVLKGFNYVVYTGSGSSGGATDGEGSSSGGSADGDVTGGDSVIESGGTENCRHKNCKTQIVQTATCTQVGIKTYTCRNCGYVKTVTTGMTEHSYGDYVIDINATETSDGVKSRYCTYCDHRSYITIIPATGSKEEPLRITVTHTEDDKTVTFTASATGGSEGYTYKFIVYNKTTDTWGLIQNFSSKNTCTWTKGSVGDRDFYVDVKDAEGNVTRSSVLNVKIEEEKPAVTLTGSAATVKPGEKFTLTASTTLGDGCTYKFIIYNPVTDQWFKLQDFNSKNTYVWTAGSDGTRQFYVDVKDAAGNVTRSKVLNVAIGTGNTEEFTVNVAVSNAAPKQGEKVTFTAKVNGDGTGYTYKMVVYNKTTKTWGLIQSFSDNSVISWTAGSAGDRDFYIDVKDASGNVVRSAAVNVKVAS